MKTFTTPLQTFLLASSLFLGACSTTGNERSEKTSASISDVEQDISKVLQQINTTNTSLKSLTQSNPSDPKKSFKKYSDNVSKMGKSGEQLLEHTEKMRAQGKEYFEEWRTEGNNYTNPQIQSLSEQRRADLNTAFAEISNSSVGVKGALKAYMTDIEEINKYLSNDLTPAGIESISPVAASAIAAGESLKNSVMPVSQSLANAKAALSQAGTQ